MIVPRARRWLIPAVLAVALSSAALYCHSVSAARGVVVRGWLDARPGLARVDLSRPGSTTVPQPQPVGTHHHGQFFYLDLGADVPPKPDPLKGLSGTVRVTDKTGREVERMVLREGLVVESGSSGRHPLGPPVTLPNGEYEMRVEVETGAGRA